MLRSIREETVVTETLQRAGSTYPRVWDAFDALCWILVRRDINGPTVGGITDIYHLHKQAAGGWGVPSLTVLYTVSDEIISLHAIRVGL
jgi:hypothetical protein